VEYVQRVSRLWTLARAYGFDLLLAVAALESALEAAVEEPERTAWFASPAIALLVLPLLARRRFPFAAAAAVWLLAAALSFVDGRLVVATSGAFAAGMAAAFLLGNLRDDIQARLGLALAVAGVLIVVANDPRRDNGNLVFLPVLFAMVWLAGYALRERADQAEAAEERASRAEREREAAARVAVAEERARIARELHDIVAHSVSVMVLQVGAVRHRLPDTRSEDREALETVERTGRTALAEMRQLLGAMRHGENAELAPQPGLDGLESLLDEVRRAGLPVELQVEGAPLTLPRALDLSAYRIIQEGLTNALKHGGATRADVLVRYGPGELELEVRDDGNGAAPNDGLGHGLIGIRERVKIYGGRMTANSVVDGGFVLSAALPLGGGRP
jgi:signal transduction histidine kinase